MPTFQEIEAVRSDLNHFFGHDDRAIEQSEIADRAVAVLSESQTSSRHRQET